MKAVMLPDRIADAWARLASEGHTGEIGVSWLRGQVMEIKVPFREAERIKA